MTASARPRFRTDLVAEPIDDDGKRFIDVVDPDSGNGFRFFEVEYSIACAMDGERDVAGIQRWAREELGVEPSAVEVATVISTLGELGYLEGSGATLAPSAAAVADDEPELVAGVVVAPPTQAPRAIEDVELGTAGAYSARAADELPASDDLELGSAGGIAAAAPPRAALVDGPELGPSGGARASEFDAPTPPPPAMPTATLRPVSSARADAEEDGPTNLPRPRSIEDDDEVSVDLSDHLAVSASDVKEAVRASKVMAAVEVPKDVLAELEANEAKAREDALAAQAAREAADREAVAREAAAREEAAREQAAREQAEREAAARDAAAAAAAAREAQAAAAREAAAREQAGRAVSELPQIPVGVSKKKPEREAAKDAAKPVTPVEQPAGGTSKALVFLLVLVILLAGAFVVWTKVLKKPLPWEKKDDAAQTATPTPGTGSQTAPTPPTPTPPPPPPKPVAPLTEKAGDVSNVVAGQVGVVAMVVADGAQVAVGDTLLRFAASSADEKKMAGFDNDLDVRYPKQLKDATAAKAKAEAAGSAGGVKTADAKIAEIQKKIDARSAERDELRAKLDALTIKAPIAGVVKLDAKIAKGARTAADQSVATVTGPASLTATFTIPPGGKTYTQDASVMVAAGDQKANCTATSVDGPTIIVSCPTDTVIAAGTSITLE